jgi:hypothetical protein
LDIGREEKLVAKISAKDVFTFGKYKDKTYQEVFDKDKPYVAWVLEADPKYYSRAQLFYTNLLDGK